MSYPNTNNGKLINKYKIEKTDGSPIDPNAEYFVLRLDKKDPATIAAIEAYTSAIFIENAELANQLLEKVGKLQQIENGKEREYCISMATMAKARYSTGIRECERVLKTLENQENTVKRFSEYRFSIFDKDGFLIGSINF